VYTFTTINANGCDSIATLNLTINYATTSTTDITACDTYTWNGVDYTNSGVYTFNATNAAGCDSIATLNLTINNSSSSNTDVTACDTYTWNGNTYTQSGVYTFNATNAAGCDSVATLNLTINQSADSLNAAITDVPTCTDSTGTISIVSPIGNGFEYSIDGGAFQTSPIFDQVTEGVHNIAVANPNACLLSSNFEVIMDEQPRLAQIDSVVGPVNICSLIGSGTVTYTVSPITPGTIYSWSLPNSGVRRIGFSGPGNSTITVEFTNRIINSTSNKIKVRSINNCGTTPDFIINLNVSLPGRLSKITASSDDICAVVGTNTSIRYTVNAVSGATSYNWNSLFSTATISHPNGLGVNDTAVDVTFSNDFIATYLTVTAQNDCGRSSISNLLISKYPVPDDFTIDGPQNVCNYTAPAGNLANYSVNFVGALYYVWSIPDGCTNFTGQGTNSISFLYPQFFAGGLVTVYAVNACGIGLPLILNINECDNLTAGNNNPASNQIKSATSNPLKVQVYPNPTTTDFNVKIASNNQSMVQVKIMDAQGRVFKTISTMPNTNIKLGNELKAGAYWIEFNQNGTKHTERILKF
jgi:hypothetical protein